jgi:hypothetical protein
MKKLIGVSMVLGGIALGLYVGLYVMFIGGIIDVVYALKMTDISAFKVAIGFAKIVCATFVGWFSGLLLLLPGLAIFSDN